MLEFLDGKKSYLLAIAAGLLTMAHSLGWLGDGTYQTLMGLVGAGGLAALRAGVTKSGI